MATIWVRSRPRSRTRSVFSSRCNARLAMANASVMSPASARIMLAFQYAEARATGEVRRSDSAMAWSHSSAASAVRPAMKRAAANVTESRMPSSVATSAAVSVVSWVWAQAIARSSWPSSRQIRHRAVALLSRVLASGASLRSRWNATAAAWSPRASSAAASTYRARMIPPLGSPGRGS